LFSLSSEERASLLDSASVQTGSFFEKRAAGWERSLLSFVKAFKHVRERSSPVTDAEKERSVASPLRKLIATGSNRQQLRELLDLRVDPRTPRRLAKLLEELEKVETVRH
jgi:hypothetical protein